MESVDWKSTMLESKSSDGRFLKMMFIGDVVLLFLFLLRGRVVWFVRKREAEEKQSGKVENIPS